MCFLRSSSCYLIVIYFVVLSNAIMFSYLWLEQNSHYSWSMGLVCVLYGRNNDISSLKKEAEFYGITPLVNRLSLCSELTSASCGGVLFHGFIPPPESSLSLVDHLEQFKSKHELQASGASNIISGK